MAACGHRVVHGKSISEPVLVDDAALAAIEDAAELAPLYAFVSFTVRCHGSMENVLHGELNIYGCPEA